MSMALKILLSFSGVAVLVLVNLFRYDQPMDVGPLVADPKAAKKDVFSQSIETIDSLEELSELQFVQTFSRPLFSETRKKYVKPVPVKKKKPVKKVAKKPPPPPKPLPKIKVLGISMANGVRRTLVKVAQEPNAKWLEAGAKINGWKVTEIADDGVKIANANREVSIALFPEKK